MFWIHGGAFYLGHSSPDMFGPDYFMDSNVVLVSANFRLGVLGELCIILYIKLVLITSVFQYLFILNYV